MDEKPLIKLCKEACKNAIQEAGTSAKNIGCLIAAYDANPLLSPGLSQVLIPKLGLDPYVRHVNAQGIASTAFGETLALAKDYLAAHPQDSVLICISGVSSYWFQNQVQGMSEVMEISKINEIADRARRQFELRKWVATMEYFLFGDGVAAAVVAENGRGIRIDNIVEVTNIEEADCLAGYSRLSRLDQPFKFGFHSYLDKEIPKLGVKYTELALERLFGKNVAKMKGVKKWAVHTGSQKILDGLAEHNGISHEKIAESHQILKDYGNLSGASLPFILQKILSTTNFSKGDNIVLLGYGWGFSASACLMEC